MRLVHAAGSVLICAGLPLFTGCSTSFSPTLNEPATYTIRTIHGTVHGGQQPITGQSIYLYATGTSGIGSASRSVLTNAVLGNTPSGGEDGSNNFYAVTDSNGDFTLTGDYTCSTGESLYIYGTGGNSGAGTGSNSHIGLLASLGTCASNSGDLSVAVPSIQLNEISTVATAYSLAGFASTPTAIGNGSTTTAGTQGMINAVANVPNIYNFSLGQPNTSTPNSTASYTGTVPANKMLWLADILGACVNTDPTDDNGTCASLFAAMPNPGSGTPPDTAQVALNMAHTQYASAAIISTLTSLIPTQPAFPYTATAYTDLALPIVYSSPLYQPGGMAIDQNGYVWAFDYNDNNSTSTIYKISPQGVGTSFSTHGANDDLFNITISPYDDSVWFYNISGDKVDVYTNGGSYNFTANSDSLQATTGGTTINGSGDAFFGVVTGSHFRFVEDGTSGANILSSGNLSSTTFAPFLTLDSNLNLWLSGPSKFLVYDSPYSSQTTSFTNSYYNPLVAGSGGTMWFPDQSTAQLDSYTSSGAGITCSGGGYNSIVPSTAQDIAFDGSGDLWVGNYSTSTTNPKTISGFNPLAAGNTCAALTTSSGIQTGANPSYTSNPAFIAADASGNLWTLNDGVNTVANTYVITFSQFLGLSVPAVTPINPALVGTTPQ